MFHGTLDHTVMLASSLGQNLFHRRFQYLGLNGRLSKKKQYLDTSCTRSLSGVFTTDTASTRSICTFGNADNIHTLNVWGLILLALSFVAVFGRQVLAYTPNTHGTKAASTLVLSVLRVRKVLDSPSILEAWRILGVSVPTIWNIVILQSRPNSNSCRRDESRRGAFARRLYGDFGRNQTSRKSMYYPRLPVGFGTSTLENR